LNAASGWPKGTAISPEKVKPRQSAAQSQPGGKERLPDVIISPKSKTTRRPQLWPRVEALLLLGGAMLLWGGLLLPARAAGATPQAVVGETAFDFGTIFEDRVLSHTFVIKNTGTATLRLEDVDPDCACTVASFDKTIPPGGQGEITLTIKPFSVIH